MRYFLKLPIIVFLGLGLLTPLQAQQSFEQRLPDFEKVAVSDRIDLLLEKEDTPSAFVTYDDVSKEDIIMEVKGKTLRIYLKGCRRGCMDHGHQNARIKVNLSYRNLSKLVVMGSQRVEQIGALDEDRFVLKAYGDSDIIMDEVRSYGFKVALFGDGNLRVNGGSVNHLVVKSFGDQEILLGRLSSEHAKLQAFGESDVDLQTHQELNISVFGESSIRYSGNPWVNRKIVLGELQLQSL
jgi:hypothetical protein